MSSGEYLQGGKIEASKFPIVVETGKQLDVAIAKGKEANGSILFTYTVEAGAKHQQFCATLSQNLNTFEIIENTSPSSESNKEVIPLAS